MSGEIEKSSPSKSADGSMSSSTAYAVSSSPIKSFRFGGEDPWRNDLNELRGRLCLLQTRIQEKEKLDSQVFANNKDEITRQQLIVESSATTTAEIEKEMIKLRDKMDLMSGRLNLIHNDLESLIAWTGFRNDETNSYKNFQDKRNSPIKSGRSLKTGKAGVEVILVERENDNQNDESWDPPSEPFQEDFDDILLDHSDLLFVKSDRTPSSKRSPRIAARTEAVSQDVSTRLETTESIDDLDEPLKVTIVRNPDTKKFMCPACPREFSKKRDTQRHHLTHTGEKPFGCNLCNTKFARKDILTKHIAKIHGARSPDVVICNPSKKSFVEGFTSEQEPLQHNFEIKPDIKEIDSDDPDYVPIPTNAAVKRGRGRPRKYPIPIASISLSSASDETGGGTAPTESHNIERIQEGLRSVERSPSTNKFHCSVCSKQFISKRDLIRHFRLHTGEKPFNCVAPGCWKSFSRHDKLTYHQRKCHFQELENIAKLSGEGGKEAQAFSCNYCTEVFSNKRLALIHISKHRIYKCSHCESTFTVIEEFSDHVKNMHGIEPPLVKGSDGEFYFLCQDCKKKFTQQRALQRHSLTCKGRRPFTCLECNKSFTQKSTLMQHRAAVHHGLKRFLCAECGRGFYTSGNYKKHMRGHRGERPYKCQLCDRAFVGLSDLRSHEAIHRGIRKHKCPECGLLFFRNYTMLRHRRTHTGEKPYMCDICGASFSQCGTLKSHKEKHNEEQRGWRPPKVKGKKYRVHPQPDLLAPVVEVTRSTTETLGNPVQNNVEVAMSEAQTGHGHHHLPPNTPLFSIHHSQVFPPTDTEPTPAQYETVDFVSIFSQRFGGF